MPAKNRSQAFYPQELPTHNIFPENGRALEFLRALGDSEVKSLKAHLKEPKGSKVLQALSSCAWVRVSPLRDCLEDSAAEVGAKHRSSHEKGVWQ